MEAPFKVGGLVEPPYFVGREKELDKLARDVRGLQQHNLIIAPRRYGKSTLLHNLKQRVDDDADLIVPYLNCRDMAGYEDFYQLITRALLTEYADKRQIAGLWKRFREVFSGSVRNAMRRIQELGGSVGELGDVYVRFREGDTDDHELIRQTFQAIRNLTDEADLNIVFLMDEFQELTQLNGFVFNTFKKELDTASRVRYFFSGSSVGLLSDIFLKEDSPLYLMVAKHYMTSLSQVDVAQFVTARLATVDIDVAHSAASEVYRLTGGIPFYVQKLGLLATQNALFDEQTALDVADIRRAFGAMLEELDGEFEARWFTRFSPLQRQIVKALAELGSARSTEVATHIKCKPTDISSSLARLRDMMILQKAEPARYSLVDRVFSAWLVNDSANP